MPLILKNRRGFLSLALKTGTSLVPVICFGENNLYTVQEIFKDSWLSNLVKKYLHSPILIFYGNFLFPRKAPVWVVVGKPVLVDQSIEKPTETDIDSLQNRYIEALKQLYDENKGKYQHSDVELILT